MKVSKQAIAINHVAIERRQKKAKKVLMDVYGIDFTEFIWLTEWNGSPVRLVTAIQKGEVATKRWLNIYLKYLKAKAGRKEVEGC